MKRKGKKTFRGTPQEHKMNAAQSLREVRKFVKHTREDLRKGDCDSAFYSLAQVLESSGYFYSDRAHANRRDVTDRTWRVSGRLMDAFKKKCLR